MVLSRRTTTATISWKTGASKDGDGVVLNDGTDQSVTFSCRPEPQTGKYQPTKDGDRIPFSYKLFADIFEGIDTIPKKEGLRIAFDDQDLTIVKLIQYQTKVEIRC